MERFTYSHRHGFDIAEIARDMILCSNERSGQRLALLTRSSRQKEP
jgi:hypothetical protein